MSRPPTSRRSILRTLGLAGVGAIGVGSNATLGLASQNDGAASPPPDGDVWPSYRYGPGNAGYNPAANGPDRPLSRWERDFDEPVSGPILGPAAVYVVQASGTVTAVDRSTGQIRWTETVDSDCSGPRDDPILALDGDRLFASLCGSLFALDAVDGTREWTVDTGRSRASAPTVVDGTVLLALDGGTVLAVDAATGEERWRVSDGIGDFTIEDHVRYTPAVGEDGETVVVRSATHVHAFALADGTERWSVEMATNAAPAVTDAVYLTSRHHVRSLSLADGSLRWERRIEEEAEDDDPRGFLDSVPTVAHGRVFVVQHTYPDNLYALDSTTGEIEWTATIATSEHRWYPMAADAERLYAPIEASLGSEGSSYSMEIVTFDPADGTEQWRFDRRSHPEDGHELAHFAPARGTLYSQIGHTLYRFDERPPGVLWRADVPEEPDHTVVAGDGAIYATSTAGGGDEIAAIEADSGVPRWRTSATVACRPVATERRLVTAGSSLQAHYGATGTTVWETPLPSRARTDICHRDGTLYVGWGNDPAGLAAVDASDGSVCWRTDGAPHDVVSVGSLATLAGDTFVATVDGGLSGFDVADGTRRWDRDDRVNWLAADESLTLASFRRRIRAIAPTGDVVWERTLANPVTGLAARDGTVLARTAGQGGRYRGLSTTDGTLEWTLKRDGSTMTLPQFADGRWYAGTGTGELLAIDPADGTTTTIASGFHGLHDRPAVSGDTVAVPSDEGFVYGFAAGE